MAHKSSVSKQKMYMLFRKKIVDPKSGVSKQKWIDYIEKWPFMVSFLNNLYIFCFDTTVLFS